MPEQPDTSTCDRIDEYRLAPLDDQGLPGYDAVVVVTAGGEERLVLCWRDGLNRTDNPYCPTTGERSPRISPAGCPRRMPPPADGAPPRRASPAGCVSRCTATPAPVTQPSSRSGASRYDHHHSIPLG